MKKIIIALGVLSLSACAGTTTASLSAEQCAADWAAVGAADGYDGAPLTKLAQYGAACERAGAPLSDADRAAWRDGWREGVAAVDGDAVYADASGHGHGHGRSHGGYSGPRIFPSVGVSVGSGGVRVGAGVGVGFGIFNLGVGF